MAKDFLTPITVPAGASGSQVPRKSEIDTLLSAKANLASPALTGTPTAPTAAVGTNTTQVATTAFVQAETADQLATATPADLGTAAVGTGTKFARDNHVHAMPTLDALANTTITSNSPGEILSWNGTAWVNSTLAEAGIAPLAAPAFTGAATIDGVAIGYRTVPQNIQSGNYTLALADSGDHIYSTNTGAQTITLPTNAVAAFPIGTAITLVNNGTTAITLNTTGTVVYKAGTSAAWASGGTLDIRGLATLMKVATDTWFISGAGLS